MTVMNRRVTTQLENAASPTSTPPRIAPGSRRQLGPIVWLFAQAAGLVAGTGPPNLFLTVGRHRRLFRGWLHFAGRLMPGGTLPRHDTELIILRVAHLRSCAYEFDQHVRLGRRAGIHEADVQRVIEGPAATGWTPRQRSLLGAVDMLHGRQSLDDTTWTQLRSHLDDAGCIEFCFLVGHYEMLATVLVTLMVHPDRPRRYLPAVPEAGSRLRRTIRKVMGCLFAIESSRAPRHR